MKHFNFKKNSHYIYIMMFIVISPLFLNQGICKSSAKPHERFFQDKRQSNLDVNSKKELDRAANQVLRGSLELYKKEQYWSCARELVILLDYYSNFERLDEVLFYLAQCLFEEDLSTSAIRMYKYLLKKFPESEFLPAVLVGMQKAYYLQDNHKMSLSIYFTILKRNISDQELLNAANYYAGLSHFNLKNYDMAINVLKKIDSNSEFYDCALYTTALAYLKKSTVATAVDYFRKVISLPIVSGERRNIVDNARLTLGYIYYELKAYKPAAQLFADISDKHETYQDALLALGWALLKVEDYQNVIKYLEKLIKLYPESANAEEAYFLLGQSHIALGDYEEAIESYQIIVDIYQDKVNLPNIIKKVSNSLELEEDRVEKLKVKLLVEETKLIDVVAFENYGENVPQHIVQEKKKIKNFTENLINTISSEKENLQMIQTNIYNLKKLAERRERRKDWSGYAEYGISRAMFLKNMKTARGN
ncbi:tetratricopeptide repeat protein [candidate division KSB1 bacterium]|nr:tetratricopeptide repeat protein [candidate division KSB1 bacterium]